MGKNHHIQCQTEPLSLLLFRVSFFPSGEKKSIFSLVVLAFKGCKGQQKEITTNQKIEVVKCVCMCGCFPAAGMEFLLQPLFTFEASLTGPGAFCWSAKCAWLYVGIGDLNSRPHACKASVLPPEPSPQSYHGFCFTCKACKKYC